MRAVVLVPAAGLKNVTSHSTCLKSMINKLTLAVLPAPLYDAVSS